MKVTDHFLVPKHIKLSVKEKEQLLAVYNVTQKEFPKILKSDPAISHIDTQVGDVIKIIRNSPVAKVSIYYRVVVSG